MPMFNCSSTLQVLQQIADAQNTTLVVKNLAHRYVLVNQVFANSVNRSIADIIGKDDCEIGVPESMVFGDPATGFPGFRALDEAAVAAGCAQTRHESAIAYQRGDVHDATTLRTPLLDADGTLTGLLIQSRDVTEFSALKTHLQHHRREINSLDEQMGALDSVVELLMGCHELVPLLQQVTDIVVERSMAEMAFVMILSDAGEFLEVVAATAAERHAPIGRTHALNEGVASVVWEHGNTTFLRDSTQGATNSFGWPAGTQRCALPLTVDGEMAGVLVVASSESSGDLEQGVNLLERLARLASVAMANAELMERTSAELERSEALSQLGQVLQQDLDPASAIDTVCRSLYRAVDAGWVVSLQPTSGTDLQMQVHVAAVADDKPEDWPAVRECREQWPSTIALPADLVDNSIYRWCLDNDEAATFSGQAGDACESNEVMQWREAAELGATVCRVIRRKDQPVGVIAIHRQRGQRPFNASERIVFRVIVDQLTSAIERHELSNALHHQAYHDSLTTLPNRHLFESELHHFLDESQAENQGGAVLFLGLDGFKYVNDTFGHPVGDKLLVEVAARLRQTLTPECMLARMAGDEFAVVLKQITCRSDATRIAQALQQSLRTDFNIDGRSLKMGTSIGVCLFPDDGQLADDLLRNADLAMYQAKTTGKGRVLHFDNRLAKATRERSRLAAELRAGIETDELRLFYQPQICARSGRVDGVEALVRWQHPNQGLLSPQHFIPLAEETGLINALGHWVLHEGVRQIPQWQGGELDNVRVCINIAAPHFQMEDFAEQVRTAIVVHGGTAEKLELEVTESVVMSDVSAVVRHLEALRALGVRIAIDDFGTGYSSLSCLQDLPLDVLKIDRSFTSSLLEEGNKDALIKAILALAEALDLECIAEGIETEAQFQRLQALGCQRGQGYLFAPAVPGHELIDTVRNIHARTGYNDNPACRAA